MEWAGLESVAHVVSNPLRTPDVQFEALEAVSPPPAAAIDGSHAVLVDNGAWWVVAVRAGACFWPGKLSVQGRILATSSETAEPAVRQAFEERGLESPRVASAEAFAETHRALAEFDASVAAIRELPEGGLLMIDGAMSQMPAGPQALADRLLDRATASDVHVAGVSKRSALHLDGQPLISALLAHGPPGRWQAAIPGQTCRVARLHERAPFAFRIDAEPATIQWLAALANDAVYLGYPYPLAKIHNAVAITGSERQRLIEMVQRQAGAGWRQFSDFHSVLDRNVARG